MRLIFTLIFILILSFIVINLNAGTLKPFKSDGCSSFPDGTMSEKDLWLSCCYQHDLAYWQGGTAMQRKQADTTLKLCVAKVGKPVVANLMLAGVRVGGTPYLPTKFRWGYGWPYFRGYQSPTLAEHELIKTELSKIKSNTIDLGK